MSQAASVARNAALLMVGNAAQKVLSFLAFTWIARLVGKEVTGSYFHIVSITSIFVTFTDLGLTSVIIRESARDALLGRRFFRFALQLKAFLIPIACLAALSYGWTIGLRDMEIWALVISALVMSADSLSTLFYGVIRGYRDLRFEAIGMLVGQTVAAFSGVTAAYFGYGVFGLIVALLLASSWNVFWSLKTLYKLHLTPQVGTGASMRDMLLMAVPFGLSGIFVKVYSYIDSQIIFHFHGDAVLGEYAVAYKLTYALQFLPMAFVAALYPSMSHAARHEKESLPVLLMGSLRLMVLFGVSMAALLAALAPVLVPFLYGETYAVSAHILQVLAWVLIPIFLDFPIGSLLNATHRAHQKTAAMGIAMVINASVNWILIPTMGAVGAAWSAIASFVTLYLIGMWYVRHEVIWTSWIRLHLQGAIVAAGIWLFVDWASYFAHPLIVTACAGFVALVLNFAVRLVTISDVQRVAGWLFKRYAGSKPIETI